MSSPLHSRVLNKIKMMKKEFHASVNERHQKKRVPQKKIEEMKIAALRFLSEKGPSDLDEIMQGLHANIVDVYESDDFRALRNARLVLLHFLDNKLDTRIGYDNSKYFFVEGSVDRRPSVQRKRAVVCIVDDSGLDQKMAHDEAVLFFKTKDEKFNPCSLHMALRQNNGKKGFLMGYKVRIVLAS